MDLTKEEMAVVIAAIRQHLPPDVEVFFFGSRVDESSRRGSDLDVLLKGVRPIDLKVVAMLRDRLEESDLPFKVDLIDYHACTPEMVRNFSKTMVKVLPPA